MSIIIGSFNMFKFSANTHKELECVRAIINKNEIDILAIQEIFSQGALNNLLRELGPGWDGRWKSPDSKSVSAAEGYAFVWNTNKICLSHRRSGEPFEPVIHRQYPHKEAGALIRDPFYARFELKNNRMTEIRLINTHIMFSLKREENDADDHDSSIKLPGAVSMRKKEFEILATKILPKIDDKDYDRYWNEVDEICRRPITILLGDYNLNLKESGAKDTFIDEPLILIREGSSEKRIITVQKDLTTLKTDLSNAETEGGYRNNFDHFTFDSNRPIRVDCYAVDAPNDPELFSGNYQKYRENVSDHLMIVMRLELT